MAIYYVDGALGNDGNAGTSPGSGNAWATIGKAASTCVAGDLVYIKASANYSLTATITFTVSGSTTAGPIIFEGYTTTPGARDGRPTITSATNSVALLSLSAVSMVRFVHLKLTHTAATRGFGFSGIGAATSSLITIDDCLIDACLSGINSTSRAISGSVIGTTIQNCISHGVQNDAAGTIFVDGCLIQNNGGDGWRWGFAATITVLFRSTIFARNAVRGFFDGNLNRSQVFPFVNCVFAENVSDGIAINASSASTGVAYMMLESNIFYGNGGYGIQIQNWTLAANTARILINRNNAFGSNTSGNLNMVPSGTNEVALSASPFVNSAGGDYSLNATAGGGAACRAAGFPGAFPGGTTTGYLDIGAVQHQDSGGGGGTVGYSRGRVVSGA